MKKSNFFFLIFIFFFIFLIFFIKKNNFIKKNLDNTIDNSKINQIKKRGYLKVGVKIDIPRFGFLNIDTNKEEGFEPDLARAIAFEIFKNKDAIKFRPITPKTRCPLLDNDELDFVIATFTVTEKRKKSYNFTNPYYTDCVTFLVNKNSGFKSINDLVGKTIGVSQSTPTKFCVQEKAKELNINLNFTEYTSYHELKTAIITGRIDAFSADKSILLGYLDENSIILDDNIGKQEYAIACKLENRDFCKLLNRIINKLKNDGTIYSLTEKWKL